MTEQELRIEAFKDAEIFNNLLTKWTGDNASILQELGDTCFENARSLKTDIPFK